MKKQIPFLNTCEKVNNTRNDNDVSVSKFENFFRYSQLGKCPNTEFFLVRKKTKKFAFLIVTLCSFFSSVFFRIWTRKNSVFGHFLHRNSFFFKYHSEVFFFSKVFLRKYTIMYVSHDFNPLMPGGNRKVTHS